MGVGKVGYFRWKSPFISGTVRDRPMVTMERQKEFILNIYFNNLYFNYFTTLLNGPALRSIPHSQ